MNNSEGKRLLLEYNLPVIFGQHSELSTPVPQVGQFVGSSAHLLDSFTFSTHYFERPIKVLIKRETTCHISDASNDNISSNKLFSYATSGKETSLQNRK